MYTLQERGVKEKDDWREYLETMERDGDIVAKLSDILNISVLHTVAKELTKEAENKGNENGAATIHFLEGFGGNLQTVSKASPTGAHTLGELYVNVAGKGCGAKRSES
ncbi:hypothetical protein OESDEN_09537 [Oesophagostomum dentatum]|uniref:Uncharacterized protein n=1 Tax=Oesophagostomum dentatum TaxID=61180 RepID=A0A0B1T4C0_OESDE|nr:hypothetical protein OESDEN_09537 [Oesophagostomum dentatum]